MIYRIIKIIGIGFQNIYFYIIVAFYSMNYVNYKKYPFIFKTKNYMNQNLYFFYKKYIFLLHNYIYYLYCECLFFLIIV